MQIRFHFVSDPLSERARIQSVAERFNSGWETICSSTPEIEISDDLRLTIRVTVALQENAAECDSLHKASQSIELLSRLASEFSVRWVVGHEFEPNLGSVSGDDRRDHLVEEIEMTIGVARSLSGLIIDDEFVEPDSETDPQDALNQEQAWDELLDPGDSFIRFPEFE